MLCRVARQGSCIMPQLENLAKHRPTSGTFPPKIQLCGQYCDPGSLTYVGHCHSICIWNGWVVSFLVHHNDRCSTLTLGLLGRKHLTFIVFCVRRNKVYNATIDIKNLRGKSSLWKSELMTRMTHSQRVPGNQLCYITQSRLGGIPGTAKSL